MPYCIYIQPARKQPWRTAKEPDGGTAYYSSEAEARDHAALIKHQWPQSRIRIGPSKAHNNKADYR